MNAEIISIGTELLLGHIVNTNTAFLSQKLAEAGIDVYNTSVVGDNPRRLAESLKQALGRSDIVITTGGLGPTVDDITIETVSKFIGKRVVLNKAILKDLKAYFQLRGMKLPTESIRQAYIPEGVKWIRNMVGTAPGLIIYYKGKVIVCLPGPPRELNPMFENKIIPYISRGRLNVPYSVDNRKSWTLKTRTIKITGLAESQVNKLAKDLLELNPPTTVGIYAKLGEVDLKIMSKARNENIAVGAIRKIEKKISARLKDYIFGYDNDTLESAVGKLLISKKNTIAVAESCTGGLLSSRLTDTNGSSAYFMMGLIAYSNLVKVARLGVDEKVLMKHGAVSKEVACQMASGIRILAGTDIGIGITGIAGPAGGTRNKPVGLVYIALDKKSRAPFVREFRFKGTREEVKFQATQVALDLIRKNI